MKGFLSRHRVIRWLLTAGLFAIIMAWGESASASDGGSYAMGAAFGVGLCVAAWLVAMLEALADTSGRQRGTSIGRVVAGWSARSSDALRRVAGRPPAGLYEAWKEYQEQRPARPMALAGRFGGALAMAVFFNGCLLASNGKAAAPFIAASSISVSAICVVLLLGRDIASSARVSLREWGGPTSSQTDEAGPAPGEPQRREDGGEVLS